MISRISYTNKEWQVLASILLVHTNKFTIILQSMYLTVDRNFKFGFEYHLNFNFRKKPQVKSSYLNRYCIH